MSQTPPDQLIDGILGHRWNPDDDGRLLNDLLDDFHRGFPIDNILRLIESSDDRAVRAGVWIASELGSKACGVFGKIKPLIESTDPKVRFNIVDCVLLCAGQMDGDSIVKFARLIEDSVAFVRWRALDGLSKLDEAQIKSALETLEPTRETNSYIHGFTLLHESTMGTIMIEQIKHVLRGDDLIMKRFAIASAIRMHLNRNMIKELSDLSADEEIANFCIDFI